MSGNNRKLATGNSLGNTDCAHRCRRQNEGMDPRREQSRLRIVSFALHATRGLIRNQSTRRWTMFIVLIIAMLLLFGGTTFLQPFLSPREHPGWFIFFWIACAWLTFLALLLAVFDLLTVKLQARAARKILREKLDDG